jgi:error-prone DNA polymerase
MQERLAKLVENWGYRDPEAVLTRHLAAAGCDPRQPRIRKFAALWTRVQGLPRHLGQHSGGMVIAGGRLDEVVPLEPATMPGRVVIQWDKEDCADLGIVKVDLLGLRMMSVIQDSLALVRTRGVEVDIAHLPDDEKVYETLQRADTIGVFQVESRAQMATLPRIHPEHFYDLVVQVAIIRPGPIVGEMVHPYINRRRGREAVRYPHPSLEPILKRTLGVPLFQEQLLRVAMVAAGFTGSEAEELRRAFGFRRHEAKMAEIETKLRSGMTRNGITGRAADDIVHAITSFALYGFPESHAASFALLAYASAYLKVHHPAPFYASLLNHQPMGFYHAATVVKDAQRHGQRVLPVDVTRSTWLCMVEPTGTAADPGADAVRLGLRYVTGLREATGLALAAARVDRPFVSVADLIARTGLARDELSTLASIGALAPLGLTRRAALWRTAHPEPGPLFVGIEPSAPNLSRSHPPSYSGSPLLENSDGATPHPPLLEKPDGATPHLSRSHPPSDPSSPLRDMTELERLVADYGGTNVTIGRHPMALRRAALAREGVTRACDLPREASHAGGGAGRLVRVAGSVIVRQRPGTAKGFVFLSLEDETGIANVIITPQLFARRRLVLVTEPFLLVEGILQSQDGVTSIRAKTVRPLTRLPHVVPSHDFG